MSDEWVRVEFSIELGIPGRLESVRKYAAAVGEVVEEVQKQRGRQIAFVDIHAAVEGAVKGDREAGCRNLMTDGCHLNGDGYKVSLQQKALALIKVMHRLLPRRY